MDEMISHYGDINRNTSFSQFINLRQKGPITKNIQQYQKISIKVKNILKNNLLDIFMGTLKEKIQHELCLFDPKYLEKYFIIERKVENKDMATRRLDTDNCRGYHVPLPKKPR